MAIARPPSNRPLQIGRQRRWGAAETMARTWRLKNLDGGNGDCGDGGDRNASGMKLQVVAVGFIAVGVAEQRCYCWRSQGVIVTAKTLEDHRYHTKVVGGEW